MTVGLAKGTSRLQKVSSKGEETSEAGAGERSLVGTVGNDGGWGWGGNNGGGSSWGGGWVSWGSGVGIHWWCWGTGGWDGTIEMSVYAVQTLFLQ